jgi:hypothetical protein
VLDKFGSDSDRILPSGPIDRKGDDCCGSITDVFDWDEKDCCGLDDGLDVGCRNEDTGFLVTGTGGLGVGGSCGLFVTRLPVSIAFEGRVCLRPELIPKNRFSNACC